MKRILVYLALSTCPLLAYSDAGLLDLAVYLKDMKADASQTNPAEATPEKRSAPKKSGQEPRKDADSSAQKPARKDQPDHAKPTKTDQAQHTTPAKRDQPEHTPVKADPTATKPEKIKKKPAGNSAAAHAPTDSLPVCEKGEMTSDPKAVKQIAKKILGIQGNFLALDFVQQTAQVLPGVYPHLKLHAEDGTLKAHFTAVIPAAEHFLASDVNEDRPVQFCVKADHRSVIAQVSTSSGSGNIATKEGQLWTITRVNSAVHNTIHLVDNQSVGPRHIDADYAAATGN